ncbi:MAG: molybdopterin-dependent oxidoreductase [Ilumatobacteraceae bacterium]
MGVRLYAAARSIGIGPLVGVVSTALGLGVGELVAGLVREASSPVVPVGQEVIDVVPPAVKDWAIAWFGTADKAVLILGTLLVLLVVGSIVGAMAMRGRLAAAVVVSSIVGVAGVAAVLARPAPTVGKVLPPVLGTLCSVGVLWWFAVRAAIDSGEQEGDDPVVAVDRRSVVRAVGVTAALAAMSAVIGRLAGRRFAVADERASVELPSVEDGPVQGSVVDEWDFGIEGVESWIVPTDDFYRIDTALSVPQVPRDSWRLRIHGMVEREMELTFADLLARDQVERHITLSCVSNDVGGGLVGNALWQGVLLAPLLEEAGLDPEATQVVSRSIDGWNCGSPTSVIMDGRDAMLAVAMNGEPLPAEHGYPVRLVVPGLYGYVSATKWVTDIELTRWEDFDGYWVPRGWSKEGPVKTMARIDRPRSGRSESPSAAGVVDIAGLAWAVHRGVSRVEVSIDGGDWTECELAGVPSDDTWRQWRYRWTGARAGSHEVRVRAFDGDGVVQPAEPRRPAPDGAQGYHRIEFDVTA